MFLTTKQSIPWKAAPMAALMLLAGCKTVTYVLQVDAISQAGKIAQENPKAKAPLSYRIRARNSTIPEENLRYKEVSDYVKTALSGQGMYEAPSADLADVIIEIDYGVETPRMKYEPVLTPIMVVQSGLPARDIGSRGSTAPPRKMVGWREEAELVIVYEKYLKLSARENRAAEEGRAPPEIWSVNVSTEDESKELRKYIPILASATVDYIDKNTKQEKAVQISEDDDAVKFIKKGM